MTVHCHLPVVPPATGVAAAMARRTKKSSDDSSEAQSQQRGGSEAVLSLTLDSRTAEPREAISAPTDAADGFQTPCSLHGLTAGLSGGSLGYLFGFGKALCLQHCNDPCTAVRGRRRGR